ncbi:hypothetical protein AB0C76_12730 [Kitasatospora sp. NPDC048722]|uniref:hypothetical protein n=1 Tax=Kitasatospora sp. NPDC048722 TaxID=3155639 RepID=UPI0033E17124
MTDFLCWRRLLPAAGCWSSLGGPGVRAAPGLGGGPGRRPAWLARPREVDPADLLRARCAEVALAGFLRDLLVHGIRSRGLALWVFTTPRTREQVGVAGLLFRPPTSPAHQRREVDRVDFRRWRLLASFGAAWPRAAGLPDAEALEVGQVDLFGPFFPMRFGCGRPPRSVSCSGLGG